MTGKSSMIAAAVFVSLHGVCLADDPAGAPPAGAGTTAATQAPMSDNDKVLYSLGYELGKDIKRQDLEPSREAILKGVEDAVSGAKPLVKPSERQAHRWEEVPQEIRETFDKLGIPEAEKRFLAGVEAQYESEVVYGSLREELQRQGVIFVDTDTAVLRIIDTDPGVAQNQIDQIAIRPAVVHHQNARFRKPPAFGADLPHVTITHGHPDLVRLEHPDPFQGTGVESDPENAALCGHALCDDIPAKGVVLVRGELYYNLLWPVLVEKFKHLPADLTAPMLIADAEVAVGK